MTKYNILFSGSAPLLKRCAKKMESFLLTKKLLEKACGNTNMFPSESLCRSIPADSFILCLNSELPAQLQYIPPAGQKAVDDYFVILKNNQSVIISGNRPRSVLSAVRYYTSAVRRAENITDKIVRTVPYRVRAVLEDFPFTCYASAGLNFNTDTYMENIASLGYTSAESNRLSPGHPMSAQWWNYEFTNPSPALFFYTKRHKGVWPEELIAANNRELLAISASAAAYDMGVHFTTFLPRPYPENFFTVNPEMRGSHFCHDYMEKAGIPKAWRLDITRPDVMEFYETMFRMLISQVPNLEHIFLWHGDLGASFAGSGEDNSDAHVLKMMKKFHVMLDGLIAAQKKNIRIWINLWGLPRSIFPAVIAEMPANVGITIKDTIGVQRQFAGLNYTIQDASVISSELGAESRKIMELSESNNRQFMLNQYHDFSEDLDPIHSFPHPVMTYKKFTALKYSKAANFSTNWGIISPEFNPLNLNQEMIFRMMWQDGQNNLDTMLGEILENAGFASVSEKIKSILPQINTAIESWPQLWALRLQDIGIRLRWLVRPLLISKPLSAQEGGYYLNHQIYKINSPHPFNDFLEVNAQQAVDLGRELQAMCGILQNAIKEMMVIRKSLYGIKKQSFNKSLYNPVLASYFLHTTLANVFLFYGTLHSASAEKKDHAEYHKKAGEIKKNEIRNTADAHAFFSCNPDTLLTVQKEWGQCLGENFPALLIKKIKIMKKNF